MTKEARFDVRIDPKQKAVAIKAAKRKGISFAEFIRRAIAEYAVAK